MTPGQQLEATAALIRQQHTDQQQATRTRVQTILEQVRARAATEPEPSPLEQEQRYQRMLQRLRDIQPKVTRTPRIITKDQP
jgi:hypothetical protein